jgi:hypothetical protein
LKNRIAKTRVGILLAAGFFAFMLDIQKEISWAFIIEMRRFKNSNSSTYRGLQLLWRIQSEIKLFWITESGRNLLGQKDLLIWFENWLRVWHKNSEQHNCDGSKISF